MPGLTQLTTITEIKEKLIANKSSKALTIIFFWATWSEQCQQVTEVLSELAKEHPSASFITVDIDQPSSQEISAVFPIKVVPTVIAIVAGKTVGITEGFNIPQIVELVQKNVNVAASATPAPATQVKPQPPSTEELNQRLKALVNSAPVMLFMKGSPEAPKCGFSRTVVELLKGQNVEYKSFDILTDNDVREGLKKLYNWPTYPQLYSNGELIGGLDVIRELIESDELKDVLSQ